MKISKELTQILIKNKDNIVCSTLLELSKKKELFINDIGFFTLAVDKENYISYIPVDRYARFKKGCLYDVWNKDKRKALARMAKPGKAMINLFGKELFGPKDIDTFSRLIYKEVVSEENSDFKILGSDKVKWAYSVNNYYEKDCGTLGGSCMKSTGCAKFLDIYEKNDVRILVKFREGKVTGRALLWDVEFKGEQVVFMDRIYTNNSNDAELFKRYAENNNWIFKHQQNHYTKVHVLTPPSYREPVETTLTFKLKDVSIQMFPYVDTFSYMSDSAMMLSNKSNGLLGEIYELVHTDGTRSGDNRVFCSRYDRYYDEEECIYSDYLEDYIPRTVVVEIDGDYFYSDSEELCDDYFGNTRKRDNCVFSNRLNSFIENSDAIFIDNINDYTVAEFVSFCDFNDNPYLKENCIKIINPNGDFDIMDKQYTVYSKTMQAYIYKTDAIQKNEDWLYPWNIDYKIGSKESFDGVLAINSLDDMIKFSVSDTIHNSLKYTNYNIVGETADIKSSIMSSRLNSALEEEIMNYIINNNS